MAMDWLVRIEGNTDEGSSLIVDEDNNATSMICTSNLSSDSGMLSCKDLIWLKEVKEEA